VGGGAGEDGVVGGGGGEEGGKRKANGEATINNVSERSKRKPREMRGGAPVT
jgi:hypothetical protein